MRTRTTLACVGLAAAAVFGPLATAGTAVAADPPPPTAPTAPAAPDAKILETVCASVQKAIEQIAAVQVVKVDGLDPAAIHDQCMQSGKVSMPDPVKEPAKQPGAVSGPEETEAGGVVLDQGGLHLGGMDLGGVRLNPLDLGDAGPAKTG
ncbi:hypothetical protein [Streptomyces venezuelae]|uniref:Secreted protein n=1 Tax=Streptomyces venezuelae TaxID=54571 RepID=A0A5P2C2K8_STRVZ|nr:hypothetical protein [Streptomyces venezuelae]QES36954.1 hypothetical protein DEJ48_29305 [Streptomyces venezuelae]